ncbi:MAG: CHRD domain-containing protein [Desulfovibrionaceae bacterium]|nr:CHRD domain-containing protein [Desulfovibrionaceae bacterium]
MSTSVPVFLRASLAALGAAVLSAGCASVNLGANYNPPPVLMPQPLPVSPPQATSQPVTPGQPIGQPLPPVGAEASAPPSSAPSAAQTHLFTLTARLEGAAVNPPTLSAASGQIDLLYDANLRLLRWKASWSGLSGPITGVQFHGIPGAGLNGPPTMIWPGPFGPAYEGRATLTLQQAQDLLDGRWYVNVFTAAYPGGEVRGQLRVVK